LLTPLLADLLSHASDSLSKVYNKLMSQPNHIDLIEFPAESAEQLQATKQFFTDVFGWNFQDYGDSYADTKDSGVTGGLIADADSRGSMPLAVIYADNLEEAREKVTAAGGTVIKDIYPFPGGRRFHFKDPAGNEVGVWSES
jgi:uncharacterized protein